MLASSPGWRRIGGSCLQAAPRAGTPSRGASACRARSLAGTGAEWGGGRALLNLGHPFGHALEAAAGFSDRLLHGEAIALGMALAFAFSAKRGLLSPAEAERVERHLAAVGLPIHVSSVPGGLPGADR